MISACSKLRVTVREPLGEIVEHQPGDEIVVPGRPSLEMPGDEVAVEDLGREGDVGHWRGRPHEWQDGVMETGASACQSRLRRRCAAGRRCCSTSSIRRSALSCDAPVATADALCTECFRALRPITAPLCPVLGLPFEVSLGPDARSAEAIADPPPFERARSAVVYNEVARALVGKLKYGDRPELARFCARLMAHGGPRALGAGRGARPGAAASRAAVLAPLQPVDRAGAGAGQAHRAAGRSGAGCPHARTPASRWASVAMRGGAMSRAPSLRIPTCSGGSRGGAWCSSTT